MAENIPEEDRLRELGEVESESCFLLYCTRESMFLEVTQQNPEIFWYSMESLFNHDVFK